MKYINLVPAYGRDYKSKSEVLEAVKAGKDFQVSDLFSPHSGAYANTQDMAVDGPVCLKIRYKKLTQVCVIQLEKDGSCAFQKAPR